MVAMCACVGVIASYHSGFGGGQCLVHITLTIPDGEAMEFSGGEQAKVGDKRPAYISFGQLLMM